MELVSLIDGDIKRLKSHNLKSLRSDLDNIFIDHLNILNTHGKLPHEMASGKDFTIHKIRLAISEPFRPTSNGARLWIYINKKQQLYIRCLLFLATEEQKPEFKSSRAHATVRKRLEEYVGV